MFKKWIFKNLEVLMITPVLTNKVWVSPDEDYFKQPSKKEWGEEIEDNFDNAHKWVDNTCGEKLVDKLSVPTEYCVDKVSSCSKTSFCNFTSTNASIDKLSSSSKSVSKCTSAIPVLSTSCFCKLCIESARLCLRMKGIKDPNPMNPHGKYNG